MAIRYWILQRRSIFAALVILTLFSAIFILLRTDVYSQETSQEPERPLAINMQVTPWASTPGDKVSLILSLTNSSALPANPEVSVILPSPVTVDYSALPAGTFVNMQSGTVSWQPYLEPLGGNRRIELWLDINVAELHKPEQLITAVIHHAGEEWNQTSTLWIGTVPQASISFSPGLVSVGQPVQLTANVIGPGPVTQLWSLDDGRVVAATNPEVVFPTAGLHQVNLQLSNPLGSVVLSSQVEISNQPVALFRVEDFTASASAPVRFVNESGGAHPLIYQWDFGDGSTTNEKSPMHQYDIPGVYQVKLTVQNEYGISKKESFVEVGSPPSFEILIPETAQVGAFHPGQVISSQSFTDIVWDMGDGRRHQGPQVSHLYWLPGDYLVTVSARNDYGESHLSQWIRVSPGILYHFLPFLREGGSSGGLSESDVSISDALAPVDIGLGPIPELPPIEFAAGTTPAEQLFVYINEARDLFDLRPLAYVHSLSVAAQSHTDDMASSGYEGHIGSDGSTPAYRLQVAGYPGGYGGEATAWGMSDAIEPVKFWLTSPAHRAILLNPAVSEVGVGFTVDYNAPNVWYWTAEFASMNLPVVAASPPQLPEPAAAPTLVALGPPQASEFILSDGAKMIFSWSWDGGLLDSQRFAIYLNSGGRVFVIGSVRQNQPSGQYQFSKNASDLAVSPGLYQWFVRLEDSTEGIVAETSPWSVLFVSDNQGQPESPSPPTEPTQSPPFETPTETPHQGGLPVETPLAVATPVPTAEP